MMQVKNRNLSLWQAGFCAASLAAGAAGWLLDAPRLAAWAWMASACLVLVGILVDSARALWQGKFGLDLIALVAIGGALALHEYLTGAVIALMFASGRALEGHAERRARQNMAALLDKAPRFANRYEDGRLAQVALAAVQPGDRLAVRPGETVPVDGLLVSSAVVDESSLTGEALPVSCAPGQALRSGIVNAGDAFDLLATSTADNSTFSQIVRLVDAAQRSRAPSARLADRYALLFAPLALAIAGLAWLLSGDPQRALAVVVVATPCPLILAVPVAIVSAMSRCAERGVLVKHGGALEMMAQVRTLFLDKTGTLTGGQARLGAVLTDGTIAADDALALAASLEQMSGHAIAQAVVGAAVARGLALSTPEQVAERSGAGLCGRVGGRELRVGALEHVLDGAALPAWAAQFVESVAFEGAAGVYLAVDGSLRAAFHLADQVRLESPRALRILRTLGVTRIVMLTGDRRDVASAVAATLGLDEVMPEQTPASKLEAIAAARTAGTTMMVGDGVNDAPALAAADIGVAMGARGAAAAAESAQVVLLVDRLDRLAFGIRIAQRARAIALQSVVAGMGLSLLAMLVAAFGYLPPVAGALLQEGIDVAVILNALRVLRLERSRSGDRISADEVERLRKDHRRLLPMIDGLAALADRADTLPPALLKEELAALNAALRSELLPHESHDDAVVYPAIARLVGGEDPLGPMSSAHREIHRLSRGLDRLGQRLSAADGAIDGAGLQELRRNLYALDAILRLHFAQEEELYHGVAS